jgi:hypothetical protein
MSYEDLLRKYQRLDRTRIFGPDWRITQQWTSLHVPWSADYHQTRFQVNVTAKTDVVIVLSQLDRTYFKSLQGQYIFKLQFRVQQVGDEEDYIVRSNVDYYMTRSVSTDITLEAGSYFVLMKITAIRLGGPTLDEVISDHAEHMRDKLIQVGLSYDIAHAKGVIIETEQEKEKREQSEKAQAAAVREKLKNQVKARKEKQWERDKKHQKRRKMRAQKRKRLAEEVAARRQLNKADDGYHFGEKDLVGGLQPDYRNVANGTSAASGVPSLTREFIGSYERSEGASTPGLEEAHNRSPTDAIGPSLESNDNETDAKTTASSNKNTLQDNPSTPRVQIDGVDAVTHIKPLRRRPPPLKSRMTPGQILDETDPNEQYQQRADPLDEPELSDLDTASEFSWRTDLDFVSQSAGSPYARSEQGRDWDRDDDLTPEPWNAVCVVGLRVYSKDPDLSLEIVRPNPYSEVVKQEAGSVLDRDDPAKGAVTEKWANTPLGGTLDFDREDRRLGG